MPRNVVTLVPRLDLLGRKQEARERLLTELARRYRCRAVEDRTEIDFSKRRTKADAKAEVTEELDRIDPGWRRLFRLYPLDRNV